MDSFEWNKIIGGVLGTALFVQAIYVGSTFIYAPAKPAKAAYEVPGLEAQGTQQLASAAPSPAEEALPDFATAIPAADIAQGGMVAEQCAACHDWTKGGPNKIGPNLYGIVDRARASHPDYDYSDAMKQKGGVWTYAELFKFLKQPQAYIPGTKMPFAGLPKPQDRIDVIAFLRMQADTPAALPPPGTNLTAGPTKQAAPDATTAKAPSP